MAISVFTASVVSIGCALAASGSPFYTTLNANWTSQNNLNLAGHNSCAPAGFEFVLCDANGDGAQIGWTVPPVDDFPGVLT